MNIKKILSVLICFFIVAPSLSGAVLPSVAAKTCANGAISEYYLSMSSAVFDMVNIVVKNIIGIGIVETAKKEVPAKQEEAKQENNEAVISNNFKSNLQTDFSAFPKFISAIGHCQILLEQIETNVLFQGWFLLLLAALLMCVRKKDANIAPIQFKYCSK
jgi:hypothetical protein